jgi:hypothetical protein
MIRQIIIDPLTPVHPIERDATTLTEPGNEGAVTPPPAQKPSGYG